MPKRAPRLCHCGRTVPAGERCACQQQATADRRAAYERQRPGARARGYDAAWQRAAAAFLAEPANRYCACGCGRRADTVDHVIAHKGNATRFWDRSNWRAYAFACHSRKTALTEGFARAGRGEGSRFRVRGPDRPGKKTRIPGELGSPELVF